MLLNCAFKYDKKCRYILGVIVDLLLGCKCNKMLLEYQKLQTPSNKAFEVAVFRGILFTERLHLYAVDIPAF